MNYTSSLTILQCHICSILAPNLQPRFSFQDQNHYNAGRGAHINLKRAEKARTLVSKLPCKLYTCSYFYWEISKSLNAPYILNNFRRTFQKAAVSYMIIIWGCLDNIYSNLRLQTMYWLWACSLQLLLTALQAVAAPPKSRSYEQAHKFYNKTTHTTIK